MHASLCGKGEPAQSTRELVGGNFYTAKRASLDIFLTPKVLNDRISVCRKLDAVIDAGFGVDASQDVAALFGIFDTRAVSAIDVKIARVVECGL